MDILDKKYRIRLYKHGNKVSENIIEEVKIFTARVIQSWKVKLSDEELSGNKKNPKRNFQEDSLLPYNLLLE